jgi:hypothetical protein
MWYSYTMEFYSGSKKNEILSFQINGWNWRTSSYVKLARLRRPKATFSLICEIQTKHKYNSIMKNRSH